MHVFAWNREEAAIEEAELSQQEFDNRQRVRQRAAERTQELQQQMLNLPPEEREVCCSGEVASETVVIVSVLAGVAVLLPFHLQGTLHDGCGVSRTLTVALSHAQGNVRFCTVGFCAAAGGNSPGSAKDHGSDPAERAYYE